MKYLLLSIIGILVTVIFGLLIKIYLMHKTVLEIVAAFQNRVSADTNTLIDISTRDPYMRKLAADINVQLRLLRKERHRYQQGDLELKEAVTNTKPEPDSMPAKVADKPVTCTVISTSFQLTLSRFSVTAETSILKVS